jgi:outer membrane receptor protein involved in Fe transport
VRSRYRITLIAGVFLLAWSGVAYSAEELPGPGDDGLMDEFALLEEALAVDEVESASKHRQSIFWSPSTITVITREDIHTSGATNMGDLLRRIPGFDVYMLKDSYPVVGARALSNASSNNQVLLLIDGREAAVELSGFPFWNLLPIKLEEIERIEVVRGPGSTLYGANAFAGVVNITTMSDRPENGADVTINEGECNRYNAFGRIRGSSGLGDGVLSYSAGGGVDVMYSASDRRDESFDGYKAHGYLRYRKGKDLDLSLHADVVGGDGTFFVHMGDIRAKGALSYSFMSRAEIGLGETSRLRALAYYTRYTCDMIYRSDFRAFDLWIADIPVIWWDAQAVAGQMQFDWRVFEEFLFIGGANVHYTFLDQRSLGITDDDELRGAWFLQVNWGIVDILQLTAGVRLDLNTDTEAAWSPRAVLVLRPRPNHAFRLGYGLAFRKPSFYETRLHIEIENFNPAMPEIVEKGIEAFGNDGLNNERVHSLEAGWLGRFLDERLRLSVDLFFNVYSDAIYFLVDLPLRMGLPDIANSTLRFDNSGERIYALGGEGELAYRPDEVWTFWCNLGLRRVADLDTDERLPTEPTLRVNVGARYLSPTGPLADVALHYVSSYKMPLIDPANTLDPPELMPLGDHFLLIARVGYRLKAFGDRVVEAGLTVRAPLGAPFREMAGIPRPVEQLLDSNSDFGGERLMRLVALYFRGAF